MTSNFDGGFLMCKEGACCAYLIFCQISKIQQKLKGNNEANVLSLELPCTEHYATINKTALDQIAKMVVEAKL
eukprot:15305035-Ditylum_brightwellii.AAC.1